MNIRKTRQPRQFRWMSDVVKPKKVLKKVALTEREIRYWNNVAAYFYLFAMFLFPQVTVKSKRIITKLPSPAHIFNSSKEWKELRLVALNIYGSVCLKCGSIKQINVDHVKPKSKYPELALDIDNLQILCWLCNREKNHHDETDYRNLK